MIERHSKEATQNEGSTYFFQKRLDQLAVLRDRHKAEKDRLYDSHIHEYSDYYGMQQNKMFLKTISWEQEEERMEKIVEEQNRDRDLMNKARAQNEKDPSMIEKLKAFYTKISSKNFEFDR